MLVSSGRASWATVSSRAKAASPGTGETVWLDAVVIPAVASASAPALKSASAEPVRRS